MKFKESEKMSKAEFLVFCLMAILSGGSIGIGGSASLLAASLYGVWGKLIGACLFSLGIYVIITYEMRLFTGMVSEIPRMGVKNMWRLPLCFICNAIGVALVAVLAYYSPVGDKIIPQAQALIVGKLEAEAWAIRALCSSFLCGVLITLSVWSVRYAPKKSLSPTLGVIFPIIVFAFCGFDHSVANMMYFYYFGKCTWQIVGYVLLSILGNILGGVMLPLVMLCKEKTQKKSEPKQSCETEQQPLKTNEN